MDEHVRLDVANHGLVVPPEAAGALFQPFRRLHDRTSNDGFGLGLAIVASIAQVQGGTVHAQATASGGLHVTVTPSAVRRSCTPSARR